MKPHGHVKQTLNSNCSLLQRLERTQCQAIEIGEHDLNEHTPVIVPTKHLCEKVTLLVISIYEDCLEEGALENFPNQTSGKGAKQATQAITLVWLGLGSNFGGASLVPIEFFW
eukprot:4299556-Amphidinium_carterae.1